MNKDLEKEYKELMTEDVPDLWGRIEAGLEPKEPASKQVSFWRKNRTWGAVAAACLCVAISAPVIYSQLRSSNMSTSENAGAAYDAAPQAPQEEMTEDAGWYENAAADNYSPAEDGYTADANAGAVYEEGDAANEAVIICMIRAEVMEVSEEENGMVYTVTVVDSDYTGFSEEDIIKLCDEYFIDEELMEGETYLFDILVPFEDDDMTEYTIIDIRYD